jgi:hypothetical protein
MDIQDTTKRSALNRANPNTLADQLRTLELGAVLGAILPQQLIKQNFVTKGKTKLASYLDLVLPDNAKALSVIYNFVRAGASNKFGVSYTADTNDTPATTTYWVTKAGDIRILASDAVTDMDIIYQPIRGDVVETYLAVASGLATIPTDLVTKGVLLLIEAELLTGFATVAGDKTILAEVATTALPATTTAALDLAHAYVCFNHSTDAGTRCRVKLLVAADRNLPTELAAEQTTV